ncbi:MAG: hypothetical protein JWP12_1554 [Bacteroidetes bacterium]|nr:hypothetical protein [Bacteroidota bacterium]
MNKEKQINEIMDSLDQLKQAEPNPYLYAKIITKINAVREEYTPVKMVWLAAASFLLLVLLNLQVMRHSSAAPDKHAGVAELARDYQLLNTTTINYN